MFFFLLFLYFFFGECGVGGCREAKTNIFID